MKKAILVVSFGTSYHETRRKTIEACENKIKESFEGYDFYRAFTSRMIINKLRKRDNMFIDNPSEALEKLYNDGYKEVVIQSLHIICGEEYNKLKDMVAEYEDKFEKISIGRPLLTYIDDYRQTVEAVRKDLDNMDIDEAVVFMGHGTEHESHASYPAIEYMFRDCGINAFVGTVEGYPEIEQVIKRLKDNNIKTVDLIPFMLVAGDHAINDMAAKYVQKSENDTQQPSKTQAVIKEEKYNPPKPETPKDKNNAVGTVGHETLSKKDDKGKTEGTLSDDDSHSSSKKTGTGNGKAEVGDKVTFASGVYHGASDGSGRTGNYYLGKQVKIAHINKGAPYPYSIVSADGKTQLGWVKLNQLKGYASGIMKVPNDQLAWTQEQGEEAIVRNDGSILTPLNRDMSVLNADMTKNLWDFMGNPSGFLNDYSNGEKFGVKNEDYSSSVEIGDITIQCNMPNVQNSKDFLRELTTNKDVEKAIRAMTVDRLNGGSSLKKYKYRS